MENTDKLVKIYGEDKKLLCSGHLLSISNGIIMVKGYDLPIIESKTNVIIEIYNDFSGISPYICKVNLSSTNQLNAFIVRTDPNIERRNALKIRTDLSFYVDTLYRNDEDITKDVPKVKINMINLSIGGMLLSSNYNLMIDDIITFKFQYDNYQIILLKAKVIRIDKIFNKVTKELSALNYGCVFEKMSSYNEAVITKYLFDRQLQLYRDR